LTVLAHLRKGETYRDLAVGFGVGTTTTYRYLREALTRARRSGVDPAGGRWPVAARKAYVTLDGTLLRIDRSRWPRATTGPTYYSGKAKAHRVNVEVIADLVGRLIWASPRCPAQGTTPGPHASTLCLRRWPPPR
jgi:hypothetical protein